MPRRPVAAKPHPHPIRTQHAFNGTPHVILAPSTSYTMLTMVVEALSQGGELREVYPEADPSTVRALLDQIEARVAAIRIQFPKV